MTPAFVHALLVGADALDKAVAEMPDKPEVDARAILAAAWQTRLILSPLARAAQRTATQLQAEARERETRAMEGVHG